MQNLTTKTKTLIILPEGEPVFHERAIEVSVDDEAAGPYITLQVFHPEAENGKVELDPADWPRIKAAVERLINEWDNPIKCCKCGKEMTYVDGWNCTTEGCYSLPDEIVEARRDGTLFPEKTSDQGAGTDASEKTL